MNFAGIDIGGAHIKVATNRGDANQFSIPLWRDKRQLETVLLEIVSMLDGNFAVGITMTAELADCFENKREGVQYIVNAVTRSLGQQAPLFYQLNGEMCSATTAIECWPSVAASNWHALAWYAFQQPPADSGFLFDIGSTTSDIVPVDRGSPVVANQTDLDRLTNRQMFYAGIGRTPVCSLLDVVQWSDQTATVARELFATMQDVFLWLEQIAPDPGSTDTADGRPATRVHAGRRLARILCSDLDDDTIPLVDAIADQAKQNMIAGLTEALRTVTRDHPAIPHLFRISGSGAWLAHEVIANTFGEASQNSSLVVVPIANGLLQNQTAPALAVARKREQVYYQERTNGDG